MFYLFIALLLQTPLSAQENHRAQLAKIQATLQKNSEMSVNFDQIVYGSLRKKERKSEGTAYFRKPSMFRWAIKTPQEKHLVYDGNVFAEINPVAKTVSIYPNSSGELEKYAELVGIVMDLDVLLERFTISRLDNNQKRAHVVLLPIRKEQGIESVELDISHTAKIIESIKILYQGGNYWQVKFREPNFTPLASDIFALPKDKSYNIRTLR